MADQMEQGLRGTTPPNSLIAEISVLGAMLQDSGVVLRAVESLKPEDFYLAEHQEIYRTMMELSLEHKPIDLTTVAAEMNRRGSLEGVGGMAYLMRLMSSVPTTANAGTYLELVQEKSLLRKLISASQNIAREAYAQQSPVQEIMAGAEKAIFDLAMNRAGSSSSRCGRCWSTPFRRWRSWRASTGRSRACPPGLLTWTAC